MDPMQIIVLSKLQIACLLVTGFISLLYFSSNREKNRLHRSFMEILIALPIYLISDICTVVTVNNMDTMSRANDICHRMFFISLIFTVFFFCNHMYNLIEVELPNTVNRRVTDIFTGLILLVAVIYSLVVKPAYEVSDISGYAVVPFATGAFSAVGIYVLLIVIALIKYRKILPLKKRRAISAALVIEFIGLYFQMNRTDLLLSGFILTLMMLAFYLTLDNPDAILLEQVRKEKEKAEAANASKSAFLSVVSHEIRTPMNAVVGMTELMLKDNENLTDKQNKYLQNIRNSGAALVMIVNDILDQSKIEAGKMELVESPYELRPMISDVEMIIENRIGSKPIKLDLAIDETIPECIVGDRLRLRQILINLMNNAVKFTEEGFIKLSIACESKKEEELYIRFGISDSGQGIREEDLAKLGEAFTQVDVQKNHSKEGTGLGLSISRDFISMMGGLLEVNSEYGKGTEFFFTIKQGKCDTKGEVSQAWNDELEFTAPDSSILIVDDTEINLLVAAEMLKPVTQNIDTAKSGEEALELVLHNKYDLIFMDYMMPHMDGVATTKWIRQQGFKMPIIALSGDSSPETISKFEEAGISDTMEKPVVPKQLKKMVHKWIVEKQ